MPDSLAAPIRFTPFALAKPWGGRDQLRRLGVSVPDEPPTGEVWLLSDVEGKPSVVAEGPARGQTLRDLVARSPGPLLGRALAGDPAHARFPLLVKLLEVRGRLSVQVHPDGPQARKNGDGQSGKFEAWSVLDVTPEARVSLGVDRTLTPDEVRALVREARLQDRLNTFAPRPGDSYVISPGLVHAAYGGLLFLEVQETADVTYRLYDWGTRGLDGKPRDLHVEKALTCADLRARSPGAPTAPAARPLAPGVQLRPVVEPGQGPFVFETLELEPGARLPAGGEGAPWVFVGLRGRARLASAGRGVPLGVAEAVLWPACLPAGELVAEEKALVGRAVPV